MILTIALRRNTSLVLLQCVNTISSDVAMLKGNWEAVISALESNANTKLAHLSLRDSASPIDLHRSLQTRLYRILTRNAHYLTEPYFSACSVAHNLNECLVEGALDAEASAMVANTLKQHA